MPWRRDWLPTPVFLPGESPVQRTLVGYSPWDHKESDSTERVKHTQVKQRTDKLRTLQSKWRDFVAAKFLPFVSWEDDCADKTILYSNNRKAWGFKGKRNLRNPMALPFLTAFLIVPQGLPWVGKMPWRRKWHPTPVFLTGKSHGRRSLVGYSPQGRKEFNMTERLHFHFHCAPVFPAEAQRK